MIKNSLLTVLLFFSFTGIVHAQNTFIPDVGFRVNSNRTSINFRDVNGSNALMEPKQSLSIASVFSWNINSKTQISFEPGFISAGSVGSIERTVWVEQQDSTLNIDLNYINIPLFVRYNRYEDRKVNPFVEAGFHFDHFRGYAIRNANAPRLADSLSNAVPNKLAISVGFGYDQLPYLKQDVSVGMRIYRDISPTWTDDNRKFIKQRNIQFYLRVAFSTEKLASRFKRDAANKKSEPNN